MPDSQKRILINGAFRGQQITGQQRYASEIAKRLLTRAGVRENATGERTQRSPVRSWARAQFAGFGRVTGERLLTLTSRGPLRVRRHVVVIHDFFVLDHPEWYSRRYVATHAPIMQAQLRSAELVVAVSEPIAERARTLVRADVPVITVPNAPAVIFQPGLPVPLSLASHGLRPRSYILAVSSEDPRKNLARLVAAHAALRPRLREQFPLVLAGGSSAIYATEGQATDGSALRLGYVDDDELARLYSSAALVAFPSLDEGFGLPAVEALASGSDVLVSDVPVLRWVCGGDAHFADPHSVTSITAALDRALTSPTPENERIRRADSVRARFSWDTSADILYSAITTLQEATR